MPKSHLERAIKKWKIGSLWAQNTSKFQHQERGECVEAFLVPPKMLHNCVFFRSEWHSMSWMCSINVILNSLKTKDTSVSNSVRSWWNGSASQTTSYPGWSHLPAVNPRWMNEPMDFSSGCHMCALCSIYICLLHWFAAHHVHWAS